MTNIYRALMTALVKNKYTKMYMKYIYFMLSILKIYFTYTKLVYLKSVKLEQLILYLMQFNCVEVQLKIS